MSLFFLLLGLYITRKERSDLRSNETLSKEVVAREFLNCKDVEPGSGVLCVMGLVDHVGLVPSGSLPEQSPSLTVFAADGRNHRLFSIYKVRHGVKKNVTLRPMNMLV